MPVPTWRLAVVVAALGVAALAVGDGAVMLALLGNAAMLVAVIADWALAPRPQSVAVHREAPGVTTLRKSTELRWEVVNPHPRRLAVRLADGLPASLDAPTRRVALTLPPRTRRTVTVPLQPRRRGDIPLGPVTVRVDGPLGLVARQATRPLPGRIRVHPRFDSRRDAELRLRRTLLLQVGQRSARGRGGGTEFEALREYTVDDPYRRIDWAATARARKPIVRDYRPERNQRVLVLLDHGRTMAAQVAGAPRLEHALDATMALTAVATRLGDQAGLLAFADLVGAALPPRSGRGQLPRMTEVLAGVHPRLVESDYRGAFVDALVRFRRRALLVLLTDLAEAPVAEVLLPALPLLTTSHLVLIGAIRDPAVDQWARAVPTDPAGAFRKAAAAGALAERARVVGLLRGHGALVVDAPPGAVAGRLVDAYLDLKATGRL